MASATLKQARKASNANKPLSPLKKFSALLQRMGKALLFPIAMLPLAAIFLRIGTALPADTAFASFVKDTFTTIANGVFNDALPFLFAIGIGFGMSKDSRGEAAISAFAAMIIVTMLTSKGPFGGVDMVERVYGRVHLGGATDIVKSAAVYDANGLVSDTVYYTSGFHPILGTSYEGLLSKNVFTGIFTGSLIAFTYNRFSGIEMPSILGFFSGRRLVPALSFMVATVGGFFWVLLFPWVGAALFYFGKALGAAQGNRWGNAGVMGAYGIVNRLLIPFGLHNVINVPLWFTAMGGTHHATDAAGHVTQVYGDINIFAGGDALGNKSGTFQAGFFPAMMFGLPAIAFLMYKKADGDIQKKRVAGLFFGAAIVAMFTGITEPIEYGFMFLAPALYGMHAILTGLFAFITGVFGIQLGFGFSAGLIDYILSVPKSLEIIQANKTGFSAVMANPGWMFAIGGVAAATYYWTGAFLVKKFNIALPGRGANKIAGDESESGSVPIAKGANKYSNDSAVILKAVGGVDNITSLGNCATRLRFVLKDNDIVDSEAIKKTKAMGQMKVTGGYQVIMGPTVEMYADEVHSQMKNGSPEIVKTTKVAPKKAASAIKALNVKSVIAGTAKPLSSMDNGAFAAMGKGIAITPAATAAAKFTSPVDGAVTLLFPMKHAVGITTDDGVELLIHIGVDTVNLKGKGFKASVKQGDKVKVGDLLITADLKTIKPLVPSIQTAVIVTSGNSVTAIAEGKLTKATKLFTVK